MTAYRVLREFVVPGSEKKDASEVLWEGSNINELSQKYPRTADTRIDDLRNFSCGDFDKFITFQQKQGNDWKECSDPRPVEQKRKRRW